MGIVRFEQQTHFRLKGVEHVLTRPISETLWEAENIKTGRRSTFEFDDLLRMYTARELEFANHSLAPQNYVPDLDGKELEIAKLRRIYVLAVIDVPNTRALLQEAIIETWKRYQQPQKPPCVTSVYEWKRKYLASGKDLRSLLDNNHRKGNRSNHNVQPEVVTLCREAINEVYLRRERSTIQSTLLRAEEKVQCENELRPDGAKLNAPTRRLIRRLIAELPAVDVYTARYGRDAARKKFRSVTQHRLTDSPLDRAEIDHTQLDVFVVDEKTFMPLGRPYLTVCIDDFSRCILGFYLGFEPPSYHTVAKCMEDCFKPKINLRQEYPLVQNDWPAHGVMRELVVDMGTEFHSESLKLACYSLGIEIHYAARKEPWFKGKIERFFGTLNRAVAHQLPGTTFANIVERGEYDPSKHACITLATLRQMVMLWIVDDYHQSIHRGLGATPVATWTAAIRPEDIPLVDTSVDLAAIMGTAHTRVLDSKGIEFEGLTYNSPELRDLLRKHGPKLNVEIRVDEQDIGSIYVLWPDPSRTYKVPALLSQYADGMSLWSHKVCKRQLSETRDAGEDRQGLIETKRRLQKLVEEDLLRKKKKSRKRSGRFIEGTATNGTARDHSSDVPPPVPDALSPAQHPQMRQESAGPVHPSAEHDELLDFAPRRKG